MLHAAGISGEKLQEVWRQDHLSVRTKSILRLGPHTISCCDSNMEGICCTNPFKSHSVRKGLLAGFDLVGSLGTGH